YRVVAPAVTRAGGAPMVGWVAVASKTGEIWAQDVPLACPQVEGQVDLAEVVRLTSGTVADGGVSCFGQVPISIAASVAVTCAGPDAASTDTANWLAEPARMTLRLTAGAASLDARVHPDLAGRTSCDPVSGTTWTVRGHFQDPAAEGCAAGAASVEVAEMARYRCRSIFVVTDLTPVAP
ncbi:MAG TPA: hypothetical protein VHM48_11640, partial [Candidatus Limnocylindrales bacterium]|nr:hypothetical protein [Candidatus Limnocylindrales bacterium]